jgi:hypothetical protein
LSVHNVSPSSNQDGLHRIQMIQRTQEVFGRTLKHFIFAPLSLETIADQLVRSNDICAFSVEHALSSNVLTSNYGLELRLAAIRSAVALEDVSTIHRILDWSF